MDSEDITLLALPILTLSILSLIFMFCVMFYIHDENEHETQRIAIKNHCEYDHQQLVWINCKGPINQEIK